MPIIFGYYDALRMMWFIVFLSSHIVQIENRSIFFFLPNWLFTIINTESYQVEKKNHFIRLCFVVRNNFFLPFCVYFTFNFVVTSKSRFVYEFCALLNNSFLFLLKTKETKIEIMAYVDGRIVFVKLKGFPILDDSSKIKTQCFIDGAKEIVSLIGNFFFV